MNISRLATTYRRSIAVTLPNGNDAWIAHETTIEATFSPEEIGANLHETLDQLRQMAIAETAGAIKKEKEALEQASKPREAEPFPSQDTALASMPQL